MADERLEPRGRKTVRIEAVAELEIGCAIEIRARQLSGVPDDGEIPTGYSAMAVRDLIAAGAQARGIAGEANRMADEIRARE